MQLRAMHLTLDFPHVTEFYFTKVRVQKAPLRSDSVSDAHY